MYVYNTELSDWITERKMRRGEKKKERRKRKVQERRNTMGKTRIIQDESRASSGSAWLQPRRLYRHLNTNGPPLVQRPAFTHLLQLVACSSSASFVDVASDEE